MDSGEKLKINRIMLPIAILDVSKKINKFANC
jgi:hypothetical protein